MEADLKEIFGMFEIPEAVRASVETAGWTSVRLFGKLFASDAEAKAKAPAKFNFQSSADVEVVAAKFAIAWEEALAASTMLKEDKLAASNPSEGCHMPIGQESTEMMDSAWKQAHDGELPPMSAKGSPAFLGLLYPALAAGKIPIVSLRQCVSDMDQHTKMTARRPKFNDKKESWSSEVQETKFLKATADSRRPWRHGPYQCFD